METVRTFITEVLDPIGIVVGLLVAIPIILTWYSVTLGARRRQRKWYWQASKGLGHRSGILIIDLLPRGDVRTGVEHFRKTHEHLSKIPNHLVFGRSLEKQLKPLDMLEVSRMLREVTAQVIRSGVSDLHCFYAGPVAPALMVGAELANTCNVILYQHGNGTYQNWGPMRQPYIG